MKVLKFGGSSIGTPERILGVKKIIETQPLPCLVVVSAFQGVTDTLHNAAVSASTGNKEYTDLLEKLIMKQKEYAEILIANNSKKRKLLEAVEGIADELRETLKGIFLLREITRHSLDQVLSSGERISSMIISNLIESSILVDSRMIIKTDYRSGSVIVDFNVTNQLIRKKFTKLDHIHIVPGYIASNLQGETTTLGRGGSDYSAAIIAAALNADIL